jgi:hypothetical protein
VVTAGIALTVAPLTPFISGVPSLTGVIGVGVGVWVVLTVTTGLVDVGQFRAALPT